jgi:hypothetical protein
MLIIIHLCSLVVKLLQCRKKKSDGNCETSTEYPVPTRVLGQQKMWTITVRDFKENH